MRNISPYLSFRFCNTLAGNVLNKRNLAKQEAATIHITGTF